MAEDKLIFPIGFDLEKGVKEAQKDADKMIARISKAFENHPITVKVQLDQKSGLSSTVKAETQRAARELTGLKKEMAEINREWNALSAKDRGGDMGAQLMARYRALTQEAKGYTSTVAAAVKLEDKLARQREKSANAAANAAQKTREYNQELRSQDGYLSRLLKRIVVYASFQAVGNFLTSVRDVTAEFELQRVSLGAIIQDQQRANQLFAEIKSFALTSPLKIMDLTKYVKQVAAYRIETDKLFDTTKRLADVSVGLGVDMGRLVLAYGQVKAASYLRAAEIRQFTEAGIPMLELLAEKFTEIQGKAVSTEQVMDLVSKRAVSFSMVEEIFKDMTDAGGMFYNMQVKQSQTLFGMWSKLGDAAAVMYDEIGNTSSVNAGMKMTIGLLESMMRNWRFVANEIMSAAVAFGVLKTASTAIKWMQVNTIAAAAAERQLAAAARQEQAAIASGNGLLKVHATMIGKLAIWNQKAALSTDFFTVAWNKLKIAMVTWGPMLIITALSSLVSWLISAWQEANRLDKELSKIFAEGTAKADEMVRNFERLAKTVVESVDGSKKQNEALQELKRTYSDVIPVQDLTIEKLRAMKGAYEDVAQAIREKIYQQNLEQQLSTIQEEYNPKIADAEKGAKKWLERFGLSDNEMGRVMRSIYTAINDGLITAEQTTKERLKIIGEIIKNETGKTVKLTTERFMLGPDIRDVAQWETVAADNAVFLSRNIVKLADAQSKMNDKIKGTTEYMEGFTDATGRYSHILKNVAKNVGEFSSALPPSSYDYKLAKQQYTIEQYAKGVRELFEDAAKNSPAAAKINIDDFFVGGEINWDAAIAAAKNAAPQFKKALGKLKSAFDEAIPSDNYVNLVTKIWETVSDKTGISMDVLQKHLKKADQSMAEYVQNLQKELGNATAAYDDMIRHNKQAKELGLTPFSSEKLKEAKDEVTGLQEALKLLIQYAMAAKGGGGRGSDTRLQKLNEIEQTLTAINKKYEELVKKEGQTAALDYVKKNYASTLEYVNKLGKKFGLKFEMPTDFEDLQTYRKNIQKVIETLKMEGYEKAAIELELKVAEGNQYKLENQIEKQIKELADRISRTKTAKEFYDKVLGMTGNVEFAANVAVHVYGAQGKDLNKQIQEQIEKLLEPSGIKIDESIFREDDTFDPKKLREFAEAQKDAIGGIESKAYQELIKLSDNADKDFAKTIEGWLKAIEKAKTASDKMLDLARTTRTEIDKITAQKGYAQTRITELLGLGTRTDEQQQELEELQGFLDVADNMIQGFKDKQAKEQVSLGYEMFKDSPMYVQMFDDLDHASTQMLENMKMRIEGLKGAWKDLTPTQLKELQARMNEIDAQLAKRNPFKTLAKSIADYSKLRKEGDSRGNKSAKDADADLMATSKAADDARKKYDELVKKYGEGAEKSVQEVIDAKKELDDAMSNEAAAQKAVENWKKVKDMIGLSANELFQMMDWGADIARGIADISEAMGADEEDVQYWNDVADALGQISGGIQDIVSAAMSGNVVGIISSTLTAIPKMFVGFTKLFSAGKIKRANKEIKLQQEILKQLEYSYGRLEKAMDKVFGADYIENYNQRMRNLEAQAEAYRKQAEAEQSKGKDADGEKVQEYMNSYRDTMDQIADMQKEISEHMLGTDLASAARDFAKAWIDAYKEFGNTTDAISDKFHDMIENMVVEGAMAEVMKKALEPMYDMIDGMKKTDFQDPEFWSSVADIMAQGIEDADKGAQTLAHFLEQAGISLRDSGGELTGISRDIASASEESINGLAAGINTQNYYISYVPKIAEHVAAMRMILESGYAPVVNNPGMVDLITLQNESMNHLAAINQHTAETVTECRRIAERCTAMAEDIHRVVVPKGSKGTHGVQVYM